MVDLYAKLIQAGMRTIDDVPAKFKAEVQAKLNA